MAIQVKPGENLFTSQVAGGCTDFAINLYQAILLESPKQNIFFSPVNIALSLGMTLAGAKNKTAEQIRNALGLSSLAEDEIHHGFRELLLVLKKEEEGNLTLQLENRIFAQTGMNIQSSYSSALEMFYDSDLGSVDFQKDPSGCTSHINSWVEKATKGKISDLITEGLITSLTRMVLTSAIYFKKKWAQEFAKEATHRKLFYISEDETVNVHMMYQKHSFRYGVSEELSCSALELPYENGFVSMVILLPHAIEGLGVLEKSLSINAIKELIKNMVKGNVHVWLPKFRLEEKLSMKKQLTRIGIEDMFQDEKADLSGITGQQDLFVGAVVHKSFVDVSEEGTEAAAATGIVLQKRSLPIREVAEFKADHPFLFLILENKYKSVLFMGAFKNPPVSDQVEGER
ncbi:leukocyte elastase inhibitor-like [Limulus polyphemus]|uniref:Leukocyte elastase inhibitor-like n=1 Tax=Limulus polyphemus TaxID=6850 RepID=A0ABM1BWU6_LIMPO|nr:leukocyte elastase inhibitor-like [Limulus polyphemus]XP_022258145.1 leukocyte elastase inhibitor-like [Limulus polyphemus]